MVKIRYYAGSYSMSGFLWGFSPEAVALMESCAYPESSPNVVIMRFWLDMASVADVLSTGEDSVAFTSNYGRLLKLVDRADLGSVGDEP